MGAYEKFRLALRALAANKFRAGLTMLGLIIGVAAVIAVMAVGGGGQTMISQELLKFGSRDAIQINRDWSLDSQQGIRTLLSVDDVAAIRDSFPQVKNVTSYFYLYMSDLKLRYKDKEAFNVDTTGVEGEAARIVDNKVLIEGRFITNDDTNNRSMVAVIDETLREQLFRTNEDVLGRELSYGPNALTIVGVVQSPKGLLSMMGEKGGNMTLPLSVAMMLDGETELVRGIGAQVVDLAQKKDVTDNLINFMKLRHGGTGNYKIQSMDSLVQMFSAVTGVMAGVISAVAAISLLVGGIGIMNIMLVSVTERTREIGLRKAIGARRGDILAQFLWEAVVLSVCGGLIGVAVGLGFASLGTLIVNAVFPDLAFSAPVSWGAVGLATGISVTIGIFFGFYPAWRASKLSPVEALRYE